jgi:general secretion pathway protein N
MSPREPATKKTGRSLAYRELKAWLRSLPPLQRVKFLNDLAAQNELFSLRLTRTVELPRDALTELLLARLGGSHKNARYIVKCFESLLGKRRFWRLVKKHVSREAPMFLALDLHGGGVLSHQVVAKPAEQAPVPYFAIYLLVLFLALAFFFISSAPAWFMASLTSRLSHGVVQLEMTEGSFWKGKAAYLTYTYSDGSGKRMENFTWDVLPSRLLQGEVAARLTLADGGGTFQGIAGVRGTRPFLSAVQATVPAPMLRSVAPILDIWAPGGTVRVDAERINLNPVQVVAPAKVSWNDASLSLTPVAPLGNYELRVTPEGDQLKLEVKTLAGALFVNGSGQYALTKGGNFRGKAQAAPGAVEQLMPLLEAMGPATNDGGSQLALKLPPLQ